VPVVVTRTEYLEIASKPLSTPAYWLTDLTPLKGSADQRGFDRLLPGATGVVAYQRRITVTKVSLPIVIVGEFDNTGTANANPFDGLQDNIDYLLANVVDPTGTGDGTRAATWHLPDGSTTKTANVHVERLEVSPLGRASVQGALMLSIPAGRFA
jgi:hypothetical protein